MHIDWAIIAGFALVYSAFSRVIDYLWITGPIIFITFGYLIGPTGFDVLHMTANADILRIMAELTLAIVLFNDASHISMAKLKAYGFIPARMLVIGLPLCIMLGTLFALILFPGMELIEMLLLATILAPTDAALSQAVLKHRAVPEPWSQAINVESGLNDGLCVPVILLFIAIASDTLGEGSAKTFALSVFVKELGVGLTVGLSIVLISYKLFQFTGKRRWIDETWLRIALPAVAIFCFSVAQSLGGSGFISAFIGGLAFSYLSNDDFKTLKSEAESTSDVFSMLTWILFGSLVVGTFHQITWEIILYSLLSLTVVRIFPIYLSLIGSHLPMEGKLFLGWFGPRGLASIVFAILALHIMLPNKPTILSVCTLTIFLSVILHGITGAFWTRRLLHSHADLSNRSS